MQKHAQHYINRLKGQLMLFAFWALVAFILWLLGII
jgi:hypothetical protein